MESSGPIEISFNSDVKSAEVVDTSQYPIFFSKEWFKFISRAYNIRIVFIDMYENAKRIAVMPLYIMERFGLKLIGSPLEGTFTPYMGPVFLDDMDATKKAYIVSRFWEFIDSKFKMTSKKKSLSITS